MGKDTGKSKRIAQISDKRLEELAKEAVIKKVLCLRQHGIPYPKSYYKGRLINIGCQGGTCWYCGLGATAPTFELHPHEKVFRSAGGKCTLSNTVYVDDICHTVLQQHLTDEMALNLLMRVRKINKDEATNILKRIRSKE